MTNGEIVQIIPADGWRQAIAIEPGETIGDDALPGLNIEEIIALVPIACFALVKPYDSQEVSTVEAVTPQDWPSYFYPVDSKLGHIDYLGPGQELTKEHAEEANRQIREWRLEQRAEKEALPL